jgi:hypothetical protein
MVEGFEFFPIANRQSQIENQLPYFAIFPITRSTNAGNS